MLNKKLIPILIVTILIAFGLNLKSMHAQKYYQQEAMISYEDLSVIEEKLDKILSMFEENDNKEVLKKLDQILENQARIEEELKIIKIRASR